MKQSNLWEHIHTWLKPGMITLLGLILIFRPDSMTSLFGTVIGTAAALAGCSLIVSFFVGYRRDALRLAAAIILMVLGFSLIRYPLSLASQLGRFIGIVLVLQSVRGLTSGVSGRDKALAIVTGIIGLILMLIPIAASRLAAAVCGVVVLIVGIGMLLEAFRLRRKQDNSIIDAR